MQLPVEWEALGRMLCALISLHSPLQRQEALLAEDHRQGPDLSSCSPNYWDFHAEVEAWA